MNELCYCVSCSEQREAMRKIIEAGQAWKQAQREADDKAFKNMSDLYRSGTEYETRRDYREFQFGVYA